ncbi:MAG: FAD-binding protein [Bacteroidetes bacterium]|nr:FAD-binding protein [Bacteroidota bacterium]
MKTLTLLLSPSEAFTEQKLKEKVREELSLDEGDTLYIKLQKRSIDSRQKSIKVQVLLQAFVNEVFEEENSTPAYQNVSEQKQVVTIVGAGPAGLFAALRCIELGLKPIVFERGKDIKSRRRDLAAINKEHVVNPESNYCFGEGGAGTYSDGKLYTRSGKRGDIEKILKTFVYHGADRTILVDAHPHIGTNKLPKIIEAIRETIIHFGGEIHFNTKLIDILVEKEQIQHVTLFNDVKKENTTRKTQHLILATGHSARDIYELLCKKNIAIEAKPFAMGVRVEHPQEIIDSIQYHCAVNQLKNIRDFLPAASYSLVHQVAGRGVYSFCMCPGGIIAPCATDVQEVVTNGWSPSKRNNPYANSGIVVGLQAADWHSFSSKKELAALELQKQLEHQAWLAGGKTQTAPAQRLVDFTENKISSSLPACSYQPGLVSVAMRPLLGATIGNSLQEGFKAFGQKMKGYLTNEALIVGVESRTSTPVRIPRNKENCQHIQVQGLYPCGEGAGYAGGIVSAAMDGERCVNEIFKSVNGILQ